MDKGGGGAQGAENEETQEDGAELGARKIGRRLDNGPGSVKRNRRDLLAREDKTERENLTNHDIFLLTCPQHCADAHA